MLSDGIHLLTEEEVCESTKLLQEESVMKSRIAYKLLIFSTLLMLFVLGLAGSAIAERDVEQESVIRNGHTYCAYNTYLTPLEAKERCKELGGHLVTISSRKENKTVYKLVKKIGQDALTIGATDDGHEGTWKWVTGEPFTYSYWHAGEPNNGLGYGQQYSQMYASDGTWDDYFGGWDGCSERKGFVCEWDYIMVYTPTGIKVSQSGSNEIKLEWIAGVNAKEYEIYRATGSNGDFRICRLTTCIS